MQSDLASYGDLTRYLSGKRTDSTAILLNQSYLHVYARDRPTGMNDGAVIDHSLCVHPTKTSI